NATALGDLASEFDFTQQPRAPMLLPVHPSTTLQNIPPFPPRGISVTAGSGRATIRWTSPLTDGGSKILNYSVTPYEGWNPLPTQPLGPTATSAPGATPADG